MHNPKVAILLCTYNGEKFLHEQMESLAAQTHDNWQLWTSDDGSVDASSAILRCYLDKWGPDRIVNLRGPGKGSSKNFMSLVHDSRIQADYYAFSDQDDVWEANKLERSLTLLKDVPSTTPALYGSRTRLVDANNNDIGLSQLFCKPPGFANALMQNIAGGNTMLFNHTARELLRSVGESTEVVIHDWWAYLAVTACGGKVVYDAYPSLRYRQHDGNLIGTNSDWSARLLRIRKLFSGHFTQWTDLNIAALQRLNGSLSPENQRILEHFIKAREQSLVPRFIALGRTGIYRQTFLGNLGLIAAALFNKL